MKSTLPNMLLRRENIRWEDQNWKGVKLYLRKDTGHVQQQGNCCESSKICFRLADNDGSVEKDGAGVRGEKKTWSNGMSWTWFQETVWELWLINCTKSAKTSGRKEKGQELITVNGRNQEKYCEVHEEMFEWSNRAVSWCEMTRCLETDRELDWINCRRSAKKTYSKANRQQVNTVNGKHRDK